MNELAELIKSKNNTMLEEQLSIDPSMVHGKTDQGVSLLQFAAYYRNAGAVEIIRRYKGELDIFEAATVGDQRTLERMVKTDRDRINTYSADGFTAIGLAAYFGHLPAVKLLLENGADPDIASGNSMHVTPLHSACAGAHFEIAAVLLDKGVHVNAKQMLGFTPLHTAAQNGDARLVTLLVNHGADIGLRADNGLSARDMAQGKGHKDIVALLDSYA